MSDQQHLNARIIRLTGRLRDAGHIEHATKLTRALTTLHDNLEDESDDAPDWRPLIRDVVNLEQAGLALLGANHE